MWVWFNVHTEHVHGIQLHLLWQAKGKNGDKETNQIIINT